MPGQSGAEPGLLRARLPLTDVHASCAEPLPAPSPMVAALASMPAPALKAKLVV